MKLYHGSNIRIKVIDLEKSKPFKDFGKGFYLSDTETQAMEMAKFKSSILGNAPIITGFEFDADGLISSNLKTKRFETYSDEWLDFIIANTRLFHLKALTLSQRPHIDHRTPQDRKLEF